MVRANKVGSRPPTTATSQEANSCKWQLLFNSEGFCGYGWKEGNTCGQLSDFRCKLFCCESCTFCHRAATKERHKTHCKTKYLKNISCVDQLSFVQPVTNVHTCSKSACRGHTEQFLENLGRPRGQLQGQESSREARPPPPPPFRNLPIWTRSRIIKSGYVHLSSGTAT